MNIPKLTPDQQAKHDEVMRLVRSYGSSAYQDQIESHDRVSTAIAQLCAQTVDGESMLSKYTRFMEEDIEQDPLERLRFFCSLAMKDGSNWIDSEKFFDDIQCERDQLKAENERLKELLGIRE